MRCSKSSSNREVYSNTILPQETRNISKKQPNLTPKAIRERRTKKPLKVSRRKEIIKIRSEINEKEKKRASLVAQWLRIGLPMQGTRV